MLYRDKDVESGHLAKQADEMASPRAVPALLRELLADHTTLRVRQGNSIVHITADCFLILAIQAAGMVGWSDRDMWLSAS